MLTPSVWSRHAQPDATGGAASVADADESHSSAFVAVTSGSSQPVLNAETLLAPYTGTLERLNDLADATDVHFQHYYRPVLEALAVYLQRLPVEAGGDSSLFAARLCRAERNLLRRTAALLPPGADPGELTREADIWTYAVFTLSLFGGLDRILTGVEVLILDRAGVSLGPWKPWLGPLHEQGASSYRIEGSPVPSADSDRWMLLAIGRLLPRRSLRWFWQYPAVFGVWLAALAGEPLPLYLASILDPPEPF